MSHSLVALCLLSPLVAASSGSAPPQLVATDLSFQTSAPSTNPPSNHLGLVPGHSVRFEIGGTAGALGVLAVSTGLAPAPLPLGADLLLLDPLALQLIGSGSLGSAGLFGLDLALPASLPLGVDLATQAFTLDSNLELRASNALEHTTTDLTPVPLTFFNKSLHPSANSQTALLITDDAAWQSFYALHLPAGAPVPAVDFSEHAVVVGFGGWYLTFGYSVQVDAIVPLAGGSVQIEQTVSTPGLGCGTLFSESKPGQIVLVDRVAAGTLANVITTSVQGPPCP